MHSLARGSGNDQAVVRGRCSRCSPGAADAEIGRALFISPVTVRNHVSNIFATLRGTIRRPAMLRVLGSPTDQR